MAKHACFVAVLLLCACIFSGCEAYEFQFGACDGPTPAPPPDCPEVCTGQCVSLPPAGWDLPMLVWVGEGLAPDCPAGTPLVAYDGHADLSDPPECPECACEPPTGECELPALLNVHPAPGCSGAALDFLPDSWVAGMCAPGDPTAGMSVKIGPLSMTETGCKASESSTPNDGTPPFWQASVRACRGYDFAPCLSPDQVCVPTAEPPPPGFSMCIFSRGEHACPTTYPVKHIAFDDVDDGRHCSTCACAPPAGGQCTSMITVSLESNCTKPVNSGLVGSALEQCIELLGLKTLQGRIATAPQYEAGACEPVGGDVVGTAELVGPATFCCREQ